MFSWLRRRLQRRRVNPRIEVTSDGFAAIGPDGISYTVRWAIIKMAAYKRDNITTDEIILAVETKEAPGVVQQFCEEWDCFSDLFEHMKERLGISASWYIEIMTPAFAPTFRVIFERSSARGNEQSANDDTAS